jgi:1-acyl-sn-glycerol-3-phosphate acyltransferase
VLVLRSVVFNVLFYLNVVVHVIGGLPTFLMPRWATIAIAKSWGRTSNVLLRAVCGITVDYRGLEKIPKGALIVASKHQSVWETFTLVALLDDPTYILKRELTWIPFFGWYLIKGGMIAVDRADARSSSSRKERGARPAPSRPTNTAWCISTARPERHACRSRSTPACSGRGASSCAIRAPSGSKCSIRSRRGSARRPSPSV